MAGLRFGLQGCLNSAARQTRNKWIPFLRSQGIAALKKQRMRVPLDVLAERKRPVGIGRPASLTPYYGTSMKGLNPKPQAPNSKP